MLPEHPLGRRLGRPIGAFIAVVVAGVAGFVGLAGVGVVEAAFWLLDPTSIVLHDAGQPVKAYAILVFAALLVTGLWIGETVAAAAFGGQLGREFRRMTAQRNIDQLESHVIVCGHGMFGETIAERLAEGDRPVVVIESDPAEYDRLVDAGTLAINDDARREDVLERAGIERARTLVAAIDDSNTNVEIALNASQLSSEVFVVVRVGDRRYEQLARRAGADAVIIPEVVSGQQIIADLETVDSGATPDGDQSSGSST